MILPPKRPRLPRPRLRPGAETPRAEKAEPDTVRAFAIAPLVPAACVGLGAAGAGPAYGAIVFAYAAAASYLTAVLLGLPLYLALPERLRRSTAATAAAAGLLAALIPALTVVSRGGGLAALAWTVPIVALGALGGLVFALIRNAPLPSGLSRGPGRPILASAEDSRREKALVAIRSTRLAHDGWLKLRIATLSGDDGVAFTREIEDHGPAVAVLPYDPERRTALLVELPRAPVLLMGTAAAFVEAPAGLRERDEDPGDCARREALEEVGVRLGRLEEAGHTWSMCGVSTERMHLFLAPYAAEDRTAEGGGLAHEHENITVVEMPLAALRDMADCNALDDMKTLCLVQTLRLRRPELFD